MHEVVIDVVSGSSPGKGSQAWQIDCGRTINGIFELTSNERKGMSKLIGLGRVNRSKGHQRPTSGGESYIQWTEGGFSWRDLDGAVTEGGA